MLSAFYFSECGMTRKDFASILVVRSSTLECAGPEGGEGCSALDQSLVSVPAQCSYSLLRITRIHNKEIYEVQMKLEKFQARNSLLMEITSNASPYNT